MTNSRADARSSKAITRLAIALVAMAALLITTAPPSDAAKPVKQTADVVQIEGGGVVGEASLSRTPNGIHFNISTTVGGALYPLPFPGPLDASWEPGDATTVWFVTFNNPGACATTPCGEGDVAAWVLTGENPAGIGVHYGAGHIAGDNTFHAAGNLKEGTPGDGEPLADAATAEVHIIVRSHGPAETLTGGLLGYALNSYEGGCAFFAAGPNTCGEPQAAIFLAP